MSDAAPARAHASPAVLIVDPLPNMAALVATMLRSLKVRTIREVADGHTAMSELRRRHYDLLILDDALRGAGSIAFSRALRASTDCANRHIPIIMMSAAPDAARIARARDAGVTEFLRKPFSAQHLEMRLAAILNAPRAFISAPDFAGPDRRRHKGDYTGEERRSRTPSTTAET